MERSLVAVLIDAVKVIEAVCIVAVLFDFERERACGGSMKRSAGYINVVASMNLNSRVRPS